ncbi:MAG: hypothetical protein K2O97_15050, partial [Acetatifactor sp.]|nr:hypothetical protein [Acetatifactor sp.]
KEKNKYIQDLSDPSDCDYAGAEHDYHRYLSGKENRRDVTGIFGRYDEQAGGKQEGHPGK